MPYTRYHPAVGDTFGLLTIISVNHRVPPSTSQLVRGGLGHRAVMIRCTCGTEKIIRVGSLMSGKIKSCGCIRSRRAQARIGN